MAKITWQNEMIKGYFDENGNFASLRVFKTKENALRAIQSLKNCKNCLDCFNCYGCSSCVRCLNCSNCDYCYRLASCKNGQDFGELL